MEGEAHHTPSFLFLLLNEKFQPEFFLAVVNYQIYNYNEKQ